MFRSLINRPVVRRFVRFAIVGTSGFVVDFSITWLFYSLLHWPILVATGLGFCFGATSNYVLNRRWTWRSDNPNVVGEFIKFFSVSLIGLGVHYGVMIGCMAIPCLRFSLPYLSIDNVWTSKLIATGVVMLWNFLANNFYTFRRTEIKD